jgi:hypothetical protein
MKRKHYRVIGALAVLVAVSGSLALTAGPASAAANFHLGFVTQPADATEGALITSVPFVTSAARVQVELLNSSNQRVANFPVTVRLTLASGPGLASATLTAPDRQTVNGVATFDPLSIGTSNEAELTDYRLVASSPDNPTFGTATSNGFDIWGTACIISDACSSVSIRNGKDVYSSSETGTFIAASAIPTSSTTPFDCPGYVPFFANQVFENTSSGTGAVSLSSHVTRDDMKAAASNGQTTVGWCVALKSPERWEKNGAAYTPVDVDGDGSADLFVALSPKCPKKSPDTFAPCIKRQFGDGNGGNFTEGFLPPGDPPRRT